MCDTIDSEARNKYKKLSYEFFLLFTMCGAAQEVPVSILDPETPGDSLLCNRLPAMRAVKSPANKKTKKNKKSIL
jgi:hypothetical protein